MTTLDYPNQASVRTNNAELVDNLVRKGWAVRPDPPEHNHLTHKARWSGTAWLIETLPPPTVPESVPAHHIRRALSAVGLRVAVEAAISALPEGHPMRDDWEYAPQIRRDSAGVETLRVGLGLTTAQVDDLFRAAGAVAT